MRTNIRVLSGIQTDDLNIQAFKTYVSNRAATVIGIILGSYDI
jgi:hypothetical protein